MNCRTKQITLVADGGNSHVGPNRARQPKWPLDKITLPIPVQISSVDVSYGPYYISAVTEISFRSRLRLMPLVET